MKLVCLAVKDEGEPLRDVVAQLPGGSGQVTLHPSCVYRTLDDLAFPEDRFYYQAVGTVEWLDVRLVPRDDSGDCTFRWEPKKVPEEVS